VISSQSGADGVIVTSSSMLFNERARLGASALAHKIPTLVSNAEMVQHGSLMSYGQDFLEIFRKAAAYVDRILKGAKPADLPIEQPTRLKLTINMRSAKTLGLTISPGLLGSADDVIE
jgi:putative ABC transport system substrate-binding protein